MNVDLCDGCGHDEHDAWDCQHRWPVATPFGVHRDRCACDRGYDGNGDLDSDEHTITRGEVEAARIRSKAHGADRQQWDVVA